LRVVSIGFAKVRAKDVVVAATGVNVVAIL